AGPMASLRQGPARRNEKPRRSGALQRCKRAKSEAELGPDVHGLAVLLGRIRQWRQAIALWRLARARRDLEVARPAIAAAPVQRLISTRIDRPRSGAGLGFFLHRDARGETALVRLRTGAGPEIGEIGNTGVRQRARQRRRGLGEIAITPRNTEVV